ncbi:hypothetical protein ACFL3V_01445 [Nanoarchaeota archaeon]
MRGFRHVSSGLVVLALALVLLILSGCGSNSCAPDKSYETREITQTVDVYADESYTVQEERLVGEKCTERNYTVVNSRHNEFNMSLGEQEWVSKPLIKGQTNYLRRIVTIWNPHDTLKSVYVDKVYWYNGSVTKRSRNPMMLLVDPKTSRETIVFWDTQYDPLLDVTLEFANTTREIKTERTCVNETEIVDLTKSRKVHSGTQDEVTGYDNIVKVKLKRDC